MSEVDETNQEKEEEVVLEGESTRDLPALLQDESPEKAKLETTPRWAAALRGFAGAVADSFSRVSTSATELFRDKELRK